MDKMKVQAGPIIKMLGVTIAVALLAIAIYAGLQAFVYSQATMRDSSWILAHLVHVPQFLIPLALIWWISEGRLEEYGFNVRQSPPTFTHKRMFGLGLLFGLVMSLQYIPQVARGGPVEVPQPVSLTSFLGNMTFQWIVVGVTEETMFRGLIQTYLMDNLTGEVKMLGHEFHIGTVIGAVFWGLFHLINALVMPLGSVVFFVVLTTFAGLLMGYAYQQTRSLLTTIIVHNTLFGVPLTIGYVLYWLL